jgi:hypothetical protein
MYLDCLDTVALLVQIWLAMTSFSDSNPRSINHFLYLILLQELVVNEYRTSTVETFDRMIKNDKDKIVKTNEL